LAEACSLAELVHVFRIRATGGEVIARGIDALVVDITGAGIVTMADPGKAFAIPLKLLVDVVFLRQLKVHFFAGVVFLRRHRAFVLGAERGTEEVEFDARPHTAEGLFRGGACGFGVSVRADGRDFGRILPGLFRFFCLDGVAKRHPGQDEARENFTHGLRDLFDGRDRRDHAALLARPSALVLSRQRLIRTESLGGVVIQLEFGGDFVFERFRANVVMHANAFRFCFLFQNFGAGDRAA